ncbi:MAG: PD-(D/E)XK nuclease family protein [Waterburya sp.]
MINLSHTAKEKYMDSPRAYYLHYLLNIREIKCGSALFFGNAIDNGLNVLIKDKNLESALDEFRKHMNTFTYNDEELDVVNSDKIKYSKADFDDSLIEVNPDWTENQKSWHSLVKKGEMMITQFNAEILPNIKKVLAVQQYMEIKNDVGDKIIGFVDLVCEWDDGATKGVIVFDNKTSSVDYSDDKIQTDAPQLATYIESPIIKKLNPEYVGYIVLSKKIRKKKEPRVKIDVKIGKIPEQLTEKTFQDYDTVLNKIKNAEFPCTQNCNKVWGPCPYKKFCESGGCDMTGLVKLKGKR